MKPLSVPGLDRSPAFVIRRAPRAAGSRSRIALRKPGRCNARLPTALLCRSAASSTPLLSPRASRLERKPADHAGLRFQGT